MQVLRQCTQRLTLSATSFIKKSDCLNNIVKTATIAPLSAVRHLYSYIPDPFENTKPEKWDNYNRKIYPPQTPDEERRPAYFCYKLKNIKYNIKKMWYVACFIRGMSVEEAIKQLSYQSLKGADIVKDAIMMAQNLAVEEHNVEYKSNLWVAESFTTKGKVTYGIRRHGKYRRAKIIYKYCNYYVRLEEGVPPKNYYLPAPKSGEELLEEWERKMRMRKIPNSL